MNATSTTSNVIRAARSVDRAENIGRPVDTAEKAVVSSLNDVVERMMTTNRTMPTSKSDHAVNLYDAAIRDAVADIERMEAEREAAQQVLEESFTERESKVRNDIVFHEQGLEAAREELKQLGAEHKQQGEELIARYDSQIAAAMRMKEANKAARDILLGDI
ncbi:hypothetical protein [Hoeflea poritis]|uniref:Uncharacterized protein n=1 Tax=Hoeflea poritis TaxID=2993659 RepID=A0ABT4VS98_9HYPH|nr:hypothetical protein [Hoeflea poritis]MDA4846952.1 hypothetical protein [Hoeflea poritis]